MHPLLNLIIILIQRCQFDKLVQLPLPKLTREREYCHRYARREEVKRSCFDMQKITFSPPLSHSAFLSVSLTHTHKDHLNSSTLDDSPSFLYFTTTILISIYNHPLFIITNQFCIFYIPLRNAKSPFLTRSAQLE